MLKQGVIQSEACDVISDETSNMRLSDSLFRRKIPVGPDGVTKHCTGLTDRTGSNSYHTSIRSPHWRLKRPLWAWRQLQTIGRCLRVRVRVSGRFRRRCGWWGRYGVSSHPGPDTPDTDAPDASYRHP